MARIVMYTKDLCPYCVSAKNLLHAKGVSWEEKNIGDDPVQRAWLVKESGQRTVPQIFINGKPYGGFSDISALDAKGELDPLLQQEDA